MIGAAIQAKRAHNSVENSSSILPPKLVCQPFSDAEDVYAPMITRYKSIIANLINKK